MNATLPVPTAGEVAPTTRRSKPTSLLPLHRVSTRTTAWSFLLGVGAVFPATLIASAFPPSPDSAARFASVALFPVSGFFAHVVMGPLIEELLYRGLVLQLSRRYLPAWLAIFISSALFGAMHFALGIDTMVPAFFMGCAFGWIALRTGSLVPGFVCHATLNCTIGFVVGPAFGFIDKIEAAAPGARLSIAELMPVWWMALSTALVIASVAILRRESNRNALRT